MRAYREEGEHGRQENKQRGTGKKRTRYSTPPNSSCCADVRPWNFEFLPTTASNEMYETGLTPPVASSLKLPRCECVDIIVCVLAIVVFRSITFLNAGMRSFASAAAATSGLGKPPKPECIALCST